MQIVTNGDNLHELSNPVSEKNKKNLLNLWSTEFAQRVVNVKLSSCLVTHQSLCASLYCLAEKGRKRTEQLVEEN